MPGTTKPASAVRLPERIPPLHPTDTHRLNQRSGVPRPPRTAALPVAHARGSRFEILSGQVRSTYGRAGQVPVRSGTEKGRPTRRVVRVPSGRAGLGPGGRRLVSPLAGYAPPHYGGDRAGCADRRGHRLRRSGGVDQTVCSQMLEPGSTPHAGRALVTCARQA